MRGLRAMTLGGCLVSILAGCASPGVRQSSPPGSSGGGYFSGISALHSEMNLRLKLLMAADDGKCGDQECTAKRRFEARVLLIGNRLSQTAFAQFPELKNRFETFSFVVADKSEYGSASSDAGTVVVFRGIDRLGLDDSALAFIMAREMSHIIVGHHQENTLSSLIVSVAAQILLPMLNVARGAATVVAGNSAVTSAVTSAAVMVGNQAIQSSKRPEQLQQAEELSLGLLVDAGFSEMQAVASLQTSLGRFPLNDDWVHELRGSIPRIEIMAIQPGYKERGDTVQLASVASIVDKSLFHEVSRTQKQIAAGADPSLVTEASATGYSGTEKDEARSAAKPSATSVQRLALRSRIANAKTTTGHWGPGGYTERSTNGELASSRGSSSAQESLYENVARNTNPQTSSGHWGPWGYTERTVTDAGEEGVIVKTVSASQANSTEKYVRVPASPKKKDPLVPQGYWGMWGYGP